jgi:hypothetical protein
MKDRTGWLWAGAMSCMWLMLAAFPLSAQTESVIYNFLGGGGGDEPTYGFVAYKYSLFSTLLHGGSEGFGEVYRLTPPTTGTTWTKRTLFSFTGQQGNGTPSGAVIADQNGNLYGAAIDGFGCCGSIYELIPPAAGETEWTENTIYAFTGGLDGDGPYGSLSMDQYGAIYGVTHFGGGGSCLCGTVFRLSHNIEFGWLFEVLHTFTGGEGGSTPNGDLLIDNSNGYIFGTTPTGGANGLGEVYSLVPPTSGTEWTFNTIHDFAGTDENDGASPNGGLAGGTNDLFGTTRSGGASAKCCGMIFELKVEIKGNPYTLINHHNFTGGQDGAIPYSGPFKDSSGNLWGTTYEGGAVTTGSGFGTIFELYPDRIIVGDWHYIVNYSFKGGPDDGAYPIGRMNQGSNGFLYGNTITGGQTSNSGVAYKFEP